MLNLPDAAASSELLQTLLDVSLTAINLLRPVYEAESGELIDFAVEYVNPVGQRMVGLPEQPDGTIRSYFPAALSNGVLDFYRQVFETSTAGQHKVNYQTDGFDNYIHLAAQRCGPLLVVSFTDTADQNRSALELPPRESQTSEREGLAAVEAAMRRTEEARAEMDLQRQQLHRILMQAPAMICIFEGPEHRFQLVNPLYQQLVGERPLIGQPIRQAMPELAGQPIFDLLDHVYRTGETYYAHEMLVQLDRTNAGGELGENYYNFIYQATRNVAGTIGGIVAFAYEVTAQVQARRQVEDSRQQVENLNEELATINEELQAANEEFLSNNAELLRTQQQLQQLNAGLEKRVLERTQALQRAQTETERQRQRLDRLFMQAPAAICILDGPDLVFELVNPGYQRLFAYQRLLHKPILEAMPEIADNAVYTTLRRVYELGGTHEEQNLLIPLVRPEDGVVENRYFNLIQQARYNEEGSIDGVLIFAFEVTEQVQAQQRADALQTEVLASAQRLAQERQTFYQLFEQTPAAICVLHGPEHSIEYYNQAYQGLFPGRHMWGQTIAETQPDAVAQGFLALLDNVYQTGQTFFGNELFLSINQLDGSPPKETYFNFTYQAYQEDGQTSGVSVFAYDVTEQVRARQQRDAQRQQLESLFMQAPAAICILNGPDLVYELVNPSYQALFPDRTLLGQPILQALPEITDHVVYQMVRRVYETGVSYEENALLIPWMDVQNGIKEDRYFNLVHQARHNEQGNIDGVVIFAFEVTEQVQARQVIEEGRQQAQALVQELATTNAELGVANNQLRRTNVDLDNFIYTASHDLKAPITNIEGLLHALQQQLPVGAQEGDVGFILAMMQGAIERFKMTIDHLTEVSKLQKEHDQPVVSVHLGDVIEGVRLDLQPLIEEAQADLIVAVDDCPLLSFSEKNLRSVVYNLLSNALKYRAPERPVQIQLRCRAEADYFVLEVQDNGLGLDLSRERQLFTMFQRYHTHVEGSGIGLYMVKKMVENAGGKIDVESEVGVGSTFLVYFRK